MNSKQTRDLLTKIQKEIKCPECNSKISPKNIKLQDLSNKNNCILDLTCNKCNLNFKGQCMIVEKLTDEGRKMNESSRIEKNKDVDPIDKHESNQIKKLLKNYKNISKHINK
jgi:ribosomal protein L37AE/L43A